MTATDTTAQLGTVRVSAHYPLHMGPATPAHLAATVELATEADAVAFVAQFPKSLGLRATTLTRYEGGRSIVTGYVTFQAKLLADGTNGGRNESGVRRYRSLRKHAQRLGVAVEWKASRSVNVYQTEEEFEAALTA